MKDITYEELQEVAKKLGYLWFTRPYDLNFWGIRNPSPTPDKFDDTIAIAYRDANGYERIFIAPFTTDPGLYYLRNPMNSLGTAIMVKGQYRGLWKPGLHKGYKALVQVKPAIFVRDYNKNGILDFNGVRRETGIIAADFHRASDVNIMASVNKWSAACQVVQVVQDFQYIMSLVTLQTKYIQDDDVSYALIGEEDL